MSLDLPASLLQRYSTQGPRYTSYPTAPVWQDSFSETDWSNALARPSTAPLALYTHLPFCEHRCLFCGCNVVITRQKDQAEKYLGYLFQEIQAVAQQLHAPTRPVIQYHWGGGTPTYLSPEQMTRLFRYHQQQFTFAPDAEISIEVDPRVTSTEQLACLRELGFNRVSLGVQDFNPAVQQAVERIQPFDLTQQMVATCRQLGFNGINLDFIYGLPHQTVSGFADTLQQLLSLSPDRIALYHYAHVPWIAPHQNAIQEADLPSSQDKLAIFQLALETLLQAGYVYIGMDHFAKATDSLALALQQGTLSRNFMGYTALPQQAELLGFGVSSISSLAGVYGQNHRKLSTYYAAIEANAFPTHRGYQLNQDDQLRRRVIMTLLCQGHWQFTAEQQTYFSTELAALVTMAQDGLLNYEPETGWLHLTSWGRILSRNVAMVFDAHLKGSTEKPVFSKTA